MGLFQHTVSYLTDSVLSSCGSLLLYHVIKAFSAKYHVIHYLKGFLKGQSTLPAYTDYFQKLQIFDSQVE